MQAPPSGGARGDSSPGRQQQLERELRSQPAAAPASAVRKSQDASDSTGAGAGVPRTTPVADAGNPATIGAAAAAAAAAAGNGAAVEDITTSGDAAPAAPLPLPPSPVAFQFVCPTFSTHPGQQLVVVGSCAALGAWEAAKGLPLTWHEGHRWAGSLEADEAEVADAEFKVRAVLVV